MNVAGQLIISAKLSYKNFNETRTVYTIFLAIVTPRTTIILKTKQDI